MLRSIMNRYIASQKMAFLGLAQWQKPYFQVDHLFQPSLFFKRKLSFFQKSSFFLRYFVKFALFWERRLIKSSMDAFFY